MQKLRVLGVGSILFAFSLAGLYACSDDEENKPSPPVTGTVEDSGTDGSTPITPTPDGSTLPEPDASTPEEDAGTKDPKAPCKADSPDNNPYCEEKVARDSCPGIGAQYDYGVDTGVLLCNNCLRQNCCEVTTKCVGNGIPDEEDGGIATAPACQEYLGCRISCFGEANEADCLAACDGNADPAIVALGKAASECEHSKCMNYPDWYQDAGPLCSEALVY